MGWDELYPVISEQAYWAVMRYDPRRKDKIQELLCQSFEKYQNDVASGKDIRKQDYKCFVTQRAKELDCRSICKKGYGGTSKIDVLSYYRRRSDVDTEVVEFDDWMIMTPRSKENVEERISFSIDFKNWQRTLDQMERKVLKYLMSGYKAWNICELLQMTYAKVKTLIRNLKNAFLNYFQPRTACLNP